MTEYDELPYDSQPIPATAPEELAVYSLLAGGPVPPVEGARVLEIGCGDGANLLPQAFHRPDGRFVGVDTSRVHIESARRAAEELGLANVRWIVGDARSVEVGGPFDYVVIHGVLSWVDGPTRHGILARGRELLDARGLLYASYNAHPGWKVRGLVREMLRRHETPGPLRARVAAARTLAAFLIEQIAIVDHPYSALLGRELRRVIDGGESYVAHEYLSEHNEAFWLREFAELASRHGLRYVGEAGFNLPDARVPAAVRGPVEKLGLPALAREELIDVLWYRQHRTSLFCRAEVAPVEPKLDGLRVAAGLRPEGPKFVGVTGYEIEPDDDGGRALLDLAHRWPAGVPIESFEGQSALFLELFGEGQLDLRLREPRTFVDPGERPRALAITRFEAERRAIVTTPGHVRLPLEPADRAMIALMDGTRTCAEIGQDCGVEPDRAEFLVSILAAWALTSSA